MTRTPLSTPAGIGALQSPVGLHTSDEAPYPGFLKVFLVWTAVGALTSFRYQLQRPPSAQIGDLAFMVAFTACYYPWVVLTPAVFRIEKRFPIESGNWKRSLMLLAAISLPLCFLASPAMSAFFNGILGLFHPALFRGWNGRFLYAHFPMAQVLYWCSVFVGYFFGSQFELRKQEQRATGLALEKSQLEAGLRQAQLDVIRARLNPHFLFNSLQNISVMTKLDPLTASRMLSRLGDLLRAVLRQDTELESTLYDEIELTRAYVALERMRFGDRLLVSFEIPPTLQTAMVPSFLLQPLIENAIIHGMRGVRKAGEIMVSVSETDGKLVVSITDNGVGPPVEALLGKKSGVGLSSTRERLANIYPEYHLFVLNRRAEGGSEARIEIPLRFAGAEDLPPVANGHEQV